MTVAVFWTYEPDVSARMVKLPMRVVLDASRVRTLPETLIETPVGTPDTD